MIVLAIDDEPCLLMLYEVICTHYGLGVVPYRDAREAIAWAVGHDADAVICDLRMRPLDGYDVVRELRTLPGYASVPIAVCTASDESEDALRRAGFSGVVRKPFTPEELLGSIGVDLVSRRVAGSDAPAAR